MKIGQIKKRGDPKIVVSGKILPLFVSISSAMLLGGLIATISAKIYVFSGINSDLPFLLYIFRIGAVDISFFFCAITLLLMLEAAGPHVRIVTTLSAAGLLGFSVINAMYLAVAGAQVDIAALLMGVDRFYEVWGILWNKVSRWPITSAGVSVMAGLFAVGFLTLQFMFTVPRRLFAEHIKSSIILAGGGIGILAFTPSTPNLPVRHLADNAAINLVASLREYTSKPEWFSASFEGFVPREIVRSSVPPRTGGKFGRNVVMLILESTRYDYVDTPGTNQRPVVDIKTPNLKRLAEEGAWATRARAVVPHTTKSVFSILCARAPILHRVNLETSERYDSQCLPEVLANDGYRTAFIQSAVGGFEFRPRLVKLMGFQKFDSWETIGGQPLGYLASDDFTLAQAFDETLNSLTRKQEPFFIAVLTSATHHPYELPDHLLKPGEEEAGLDVKQRYRRLVEDEDALLGEMLSVLERKGVKENTIVVVVGDHGEGFGEKGVKQHDNNFFEEGLRVPLVFNGPGVPPGNIKGNISLIDVTPTLLNLMGYQYSLDVEDLHNGRNVFSVQKKNRPRYFFCYFERACAGFVLNDTKVVYLLMRRQLVYFDLSMDPDELMPRELLPNLMRETTNLLDYYASRRIALWSPELEFRAALRTEDGWFCPRDGNCTHPKSPANLFHKGAKQ